MGPSGAPSPILLPRRAGATAHHVADTVNGNALKKRAATDSGALWCALQQSPHLATGHGKILVMPASRLPADHLLELRIFQNRLVSVAEEMGEVLMRTAFSPNIKERRDFSCAAFDAAGRLLAQAAHIPVHLGAMPLAARAALDAAAPEGWRPGDVMALNDPYAGGTHLPDLTMISPVFAGVPPRARGRRRLIGFVASRAHQADIGGMSPGSMPLATELIQEGVIVPPIKLLERGQWNRAALALLLRNVRTPEERLGDLEAQVAAHRTGEQRLAELAMRYPPRAWRRHVASLLAYSERLTRRALQTIPPGTSTFVDWLDGDGVSSGRLRLQVAITVTADGRLIADFAGSAPQTLGPMNAVLAVTTSAVAYCVRCLAGEELPANAGAMAPIEVRAPQGSLVNAQPPHAVCGGNVETSQRIVDAVFGALAQALPSRIPAASQGTMNNVTLGGTDPRTGRPFAYYETIGGGAGASPEGPGLSGIHVHMSNTLNTPVEALEFAYPLRVIEYALRRGSGGRGRHRGGDGLRRVIELQASATATLLSERRETAPWGLAGGEPGQPGRNWLRRRAPSGRWPDAQPARDGADAPPAGLATPEEELPGKVTVRLEPGDILGIETPGGGGWGA